MAERPSTPRGCSVLLANVDMVGLRDPWLELTGGHRGVWSVMQKSLSICQSRASPRRSQG